MPSFPTLQALDLFCGLGGWSDGLAMEGFKVLGVEINQEIADLYKHPVICEDARTLDPRDFTGYDLIVGSPPCREFTKLTDKGHTPWTQPKNKDAGLELVQCFLKFVEGAKPTFWLMENVPDLREHIDLKPRQVSRLTRGKRRVFWGNYPAFLITRDYSVPLHNNIGGKYRSWIRAIIPLPVARGLGRAVSESMNREGS